MPISSVCFQNYSSIWQQKIDTISTYFRLPNKSNFCFHQLFSNNLLDFTFLSESITTNTTIESSIIFQTMGLDKKFPVTNFTFSNYLCCSRLIKTLFATIFANSSFYFRKTSLKFPPTNRTFSSNIRTHSLIGANPTTIFTSVLSHFTQSSLKYLPSKNRESFILENFVSTKTSRSRAN